MGLVYDQTACHKREIITRGDYFPGVVTHGVFDNGKRIYFGAKGYQDYTTHGDKERKKRYIARHNKEADLWMNKPDSAAALSRWILWEYSDINKAIREYNGRF